MSRITASRRVFLKGVAAGAAIVGAPSIGLAKGANEKINLACCGIGNRGAQLMMDHVRTGLVNIVALCDTQMGDAHTQKILKQFPNVPRFQDFRQMFDKMGNQIDAVTAGVPDHTHFPIAMMAMGLGKHVHTEKPMAHTYQEVKLMMEAARKNKVATQMGNQGHSGDNYHQFKMLVETGMMKNVTKIIAHMNGARRWHKWNGNVPSLPAAQPIPASLDWDTWLSQAQLHDFNKDYLNGDWRCWYDFGNGALGDWGAHIMDTAHEFLKLGMPNEVGVLKMEGHNPYVFPMASTLSFKFPEREGLPACEIQWYEGVKNFPELPAGFTAATAAGDIPVAGGGSTTTAKLGPGKEIYAEGHVFKGGSHGTKLELVDRTQQKELSDKMNNFPKGQSDHAKNFLLGCKGEEVCRSRFEVAGPLSQVLTLGCIAQRLNTTYAFDAKTEQITNNKEANLLLNGPAPRKGWEQFYTV